MVAREAPMSRPGPAGLRREENRAPDAFECPQAEDEISMVSPDFLRHRSCHSHRTPARSITET